MIFTNNRAPLQSSFPLLTNLLPSLQSACKLYRYQEKNVKRKHLLRSKIREEEIPPKEINVKTVKSKNSSCSRNTFPLVASSYTQSRIRRIQTAVFGNSINRGTTHT